MAVPKKRTGHSAQGHRRSKWKAIKQETTKCPNCGEIVLTHTVCTACGTYKGKPVSLKDRVEEIPVKEEKKAASTKSAKSSEASSDTESPVKAKKITKKAVKEEVKETKTVKKGAKAETAKTEDVVEQTPAEQAPEEETSEDK